MPSLCRSEPKSAWTFVGLALASLATLVAASACGETTRAKTCPAPPAFQGCGCSLDENCSMVCLYCANSTGGFPSSSSSGGASGSEGLIFRDATVGANRGSGGVPIDSGQRDSGATDGGIDGAVFQGGPCDRDTCAVGQVCLTMTTVSGQYNPGGAGSPQPSTQTTRACRTVPLSCSAEGPCDAECCQAFCGGGGGAMCTCSLSRTTGSCYLGLP